MEQDRLAPMQIERHVHELLHLVRALKVEMGPHGHQELPREAEAHPHRTESAWNDAITQVNQRIVGLETLVEHQETMGFSSDESRGELAAYRRVLDWLHEQCSSVDSHSSAGSNKVAG